MVFFLTPAPHLLPSFLEWRKVVYYLADELFGIVYQRERLL